MATVYDSVTWVIPTPASTTGYAGPKLPNAVTAVEISSYTVGGTSVAFNIEERSACNSAGTDMLASDQTADADGTSATSFSNGGLAANCFPFLAVTTVTGAVTTLAVTMAYSYSV